MKLIHYGNSKYNPSLFQPIQNSWVKPKGGLWASPVNSKDSWKNWCLEENFNCISLDQSFEFEIEGNILVIDSYEDLLTKVIWFEKYDEIYPDFEAMLMLGIDAIHLTEEGQCRTRFAKEGYSLKLYGWDCESVLVLNPDCIKI